MMPISRRTLLGRLGAGAAVALSAQRLAADSLRATRGGALPDAARSGELIRLNRNENAYGPSAAAIAAIRDTASDGARQYPDLAAGALRRQIAHLHGVTPDHVVLGCGSGELLRAAVDAFAGPQKTLIAALPTFESVAVCAQRASAELVGVPLRKDFSHDLGAMLARSGAATGLVYICNPNSPTASLTRRQELDDFLRALPATSVVLIDEAYHHYVGELPDYMSFLERPVDDPRVIVTRSFSKIHGLAGLRVGYAVAAPRTARVLASHGLADGVNVVAARAASAALDDREHVRMSVSRNADDRQEFLNQAIARMLRVDSVANFVMLPTGRPALDVVERFRAHRILVAGPVPAFKQHIRVSLGTPDEMREFWRVWDLLPAVHNMGM